MRWCVILLWLVGGSALAQTTLVERLPGGKPTFVQQPTAWTANDLACVTSANEISIGGACNALGGGGGGAPTSSQYLTLATDGTLTNERVFTPGAGIAGADGGAGGTYTLTWSPSTQVNNLTVFNGANSSRTITYDLSGTDPVVTLSSSSFDVSTGTLKQGGTAVALQSRSLTAGAGLSGGGDISADRTFATDSTEAGFVASSTASCGASTAGKMGVASGLLSYCGSDNLQHFAAYGDSSGGATSLTASTLCTVATDGAPCWDSDDDLLEVGTGSVLKTMVDTNSTQTASNKTLTSAGTIAVGTGAAPKSSVGMAKIAVDGTNASTAGPHLQFTTASDNNPLFSVYPLTHGENLLLWDAYSDDAGTTWKSSNSTSNWMLGTIFGSYFLFYNTGTTAGSAITWKQAMSATGSAITFNADSSNYDTIVNGDTIAGLVTVDASADSVGIGGITTPSARLHLREPTSGNEAFRIDTAASATTDKPRMSVYQKDVTTTDATTTTLFNTTLATNTTYLVKAFITARRTGGASGSSNDSGTYELWCRGRRGGAGAVVDGTATCPWGATGCANPVVMFQVEDQTAWAVTCDASSNDVRIRVTGASANNVSWGGTIEVFPMGS